jgi:hypothetical protein
MQKTLILALLMVSVNLSIAQPNFVPGKVVLTSGDTIEGLIDDEHWDVNPMKIEFQRSTSSATEELGLSDIRAFILSNGLHFERHFVKFDNSREGLNYLSPSRDPLTYAEGEYFLRLYIHGGISLFSLADENLRVHYFIQDGNKNPVELLNRSFHANLSGRPIVRTFEAWKQQLAVIGAKCPDQSRRIISSEYTRSSLEKLVLQINECLGTPSVLVKPELQADFRRTAQFGLALQAYSVYTAYTGLSTIPTRYNGVNLAQAFLRKYFSGAKRHFTMS